MQNVGKRISNKEKKHIFCWDTSHIFLIGGFVRRGAEEKKSSLDSQIVWKKITTKKYFALLATTDSHAIFYR